VSGGLSRSKSRPRSVRFGVVLQEMCSVKLAFSCAASFVEVMNAGYHGAPDSPPYVIHSAMVDDGLPPRPAFFAGREGRSLLPDGSRSPQRL
jgi:hypothetical protein